MSVYVISPKSKHFMNTLSHINNKIIFKAYRNLCSQNMNDYKTFKQLLVKAKNIVALSGAGISAESGIPVFRGTGGWWRTYRATELATPEAFETNPALVWEFYHYRRTVAFSCQPNKVCCIL